MDKFILTIVLRKEVLSIDAGKAAITIVKSKLEDVEGVEITEAINVRFDEIPE